MLERKISEAKTTKMHLMKKQKEDAKKQQEFTKTKTREIQRLRLKERTAMKEVSKLKSENQRLKANLKRSKARCEKLSEQSKQTELSLARVLANRAKGNGTPRNGDMDCMGQFASMTEELSSLSFVLEKALENKVDISRNKQMYDEKVAEREKLELSMSAEVVLLKEKKTKCKEFGSEPPEDVVICEVRDCQDNIQELSLKIELLENDIGLIRENYPSVEDEDYGCADAFDTQDSALMVLSKQSSPALRTLIVKLLTSCHDSELGRRNLLDSKARDDSTLSNLRNELVLKNERIDALSKSLERQRQNFQVGSEVRDNKYKQLENEAKITNAQLDSCVADKTKLLLELERARELLSLSQESNAKLEGQLASLEYQLVRNETSQVIGQSETKMISKRPPSPASRGYVFVETDSVTPKEATIKPTSSQGAQSSVKKLVEAYSATSKETQQSPNRPLSKMPFGLKHTFKGVMNRNK